MLRNKGEALGILKPAYFISKKGYVSFHEISPLYNDEDEITLKKIPLKDQLGKTIENIDLALAIKEIPVENLFEISFYFKDGKEVDDGLLKFIKEKLNKKFNNPKIKMINYHETLLKGNILIKISFKAKK